MTCSQRLSKITHPCLIPDSLMFTFPLSPHESNNRSCDLHERDKTPKKCDDSFASFVRHHALHFLLSSQHTKFPSIIRVSHKFSFSISIHISWYQILRCPRMIPPTTTTSLFLPSLFNIHLRLS